MSFGRRDDERLNDDIVYFLQIPGWKSHRAILRLKKKRTRAILPAFSRIRDPERASICT